LISIAGGGGGGGGGGNNAGGNVNKNGNNTGVFPSWITNINNISRSAGQDGFGVDRSPTTNPPYINQGSGDDGGGGGGGGGPFGIGGPIPTVVITDPKSGVTNTYHHYDRSGGGGQSGLSVTNLTASGAFTWYTLNAETMSTRISRVNGPGNGGQATRPTSQFGTYGAVSVAWTTQTAIPTNGLDFVPALVTS
jgi:hypothetical protein